MSQIKKCTICDEDKDLESYYSITKTKKDSSTYLYYYPYCKECTKKKSTKWRDDNREYFREHRKKYNHERRKRPEIQITERQHSREQRESGYIKEYYKRNKEYFYIYHKQRNMNKKHEISKHEWEMCKKYFDYSCAYCGLHLNEHFIKYKGELKKTELHKEHVDHEGSNDLSNCVPACQNCNSTKWSFKLEDWYSTQDNYSEERLAKVYKWINEDHKLFIDKDKKSRSVNDEREKTGES